jgi:hypothetical protein
MINAYVLYNSVDRGFSTHEELEVLQQELKEPKVVFLDTEEEKILMMFNIVAATRREMEIMDKHNIFYTNSIEEGKQMRIDGRIFYGVDPEKVIGPDKEKKQPAAN